jgi:hypothetical protein
MLPHPDFIARLPTATRRLSASAAIVERRRAPAIGHCARHLKDCASGTRRGCVHLDSLQALVPDALQHVMKGAPVSCAHLVVCGADVILVMGQGQLMEQGTHEELLARGVCVAGRAQLGWKRFSE